MEAESLRAVRELFLAFAKEKPAILVRMQQGQRKQPENSPAGAIITPRGMTRVELPQDACWTAINHVEFAVSRQTDDGKVWRRYSVITRAEQAAARTYRWRQMTGDPREAEWQELMRAVDRKRALWSEFAELASEAARYLAADRPTASNWTDAVFDWSINLANGHPSRSPIFADETVPIESFPSESFIAEISNIAWRSADYCAWLGQAVSEGTGGHKTPKKRRGRPPTIDRDIEWMKLVDSGQKTQVQIATENEITEGAVSRGIARARGSSQKP